MALPGDALGPGIAHRRAPEAHQRHKAAQIEIHFPEVGKLLQDPRAHQAVVGMVVHDLRPHCREQLIEALGSETLEEAVRLPARAHAVDDVIALQILLHHLIHGVDVVLPVTVDGDGDVAAVLCLHEAGQHGILVAAVAALGNAEIVRILFCQVFDDLPGVVPAAVVDKQHAAVLADFPGGGEVLHLVQELRSCYREYRLFVVAWDHDVENGGHAHTPPLSSGPKR